MELWDLYDKDRRPLGRTHQRGLPVPPGAYHLAVIVVILNPKGEVLLTRRAPEKDACPGWWENTGGSVLAGETSLEAITRELREETGLAARPEEFTLLLREDCRTDAHFDIYALTWEGAPEDIRFQAGETDAARWVPLAYAAEPEIPSGGRGRHRGHPLPRPGRGVQAGAVPPHRPVSAGPAGVFLKGGTLCQSCGTCMISTVDL